MNRIEFAQCMAYLGAAIGKQLPTESVEVYFDLLGDLPKEVLQTAAKRVVLEHKWATFPSVAEIREAAAETMMGEKKRLSPSEAWELAWEATKKIDPDIEGSLQRHTENLPALVIEAMRVFGIVSLVRGKEPISITRSQFLKVYEQLQERESRLNLLPQKVKDSIEKIGRDYKALPEVSRKLIENIGKGVEDA